jgi:hypothetical protein
VKAEQLNEYHVRFKNSLRSADYSNAQLQLAQYGEQPISEETEITYSQFLRALGLLKLTTLPFVDFSDQSRTLPAEE